MRAAGVRRVGADVEVLSLPEPRPLLPDEVLIAAAGGRGVDLAVSAASGGAGPALTAVRDGGALATITSDAPDRQREMP